MIVNNKAYQINALFINILLIVLFDGFFPLLLGLEYHTYIDINIQHFI